MLDSSLEHGWTIWDEWHRPITIRKVFAPVEQEGAPLSSAFAAGSLDHWLSSRFNAETLFEIYEALGGSAAARQDVLQRQQHLELLKKRLTESFHSGELMAFAHPLPSMVVRRNELSVGSIPDDAPAPSQSDPLVDSGGNEAGTGEAAKPRWTEAEIKAEWAKTEAGQRVLANLPNSTKFESYSKKPGERRNAYYSPRENAIYIPDHYTSTEAAPTAAHEAVHADQCVNHKRPVDLNDRVEMEVEAKHVGLDVYEQMGRPTLPYDYVAESEFRARDLNGYNQAVRSTYRKLYGIE